jgi:hypothetical protein
LPKLPELSRGGCAFGEPVDGDLPAIGPLGPALLDLLLLEPALLELLPRRDACGIAVVDSDAPLGRPLLNANGALGTNGALNALALNTLRGGALAFGALDALAFNTLRSCALALDSLPRLGTLGADPLANLRALGADPLPGLRAFDSNALLAALGRLRAGCGALRALLGAVSLLSALLGLAAVATLGVRRSADSDCRHGRDQKCLGHREFQ